jgi:hypothetical protein
MVISVWIIAVIIFAVSVIMAAIDNAWRSPLLWAVWSLCVLALFRGMS